MTDNFHECFSQGIVSTLKISSCSLTNFADMSNIFFSVRSDVFILEFWSFWKFFPMNVAAFIVTAINIPQIIECSSLSPATLDIIFCLFRTSSFTRFTNSVASLPMMKFWEFASSWELTSSGCPDLSRNSSSFLTDCAVLEMTSGRRRNRQSVEWGRLRRNRSGYGHEVRLFIQWETLRSRDARVGVFRASILRLRQKRKRDEYRPWRSGSAPSKMRWSVLSRVITTCSHVWSSSLGRQRTALKLERREGGWVMGRLRSCVCQKRNPDSSF